MCKLKVLCEVSHNIEQIDNLPEYLVVDSTISMSGCCDLTMPLVTKWHQQE